jgi:hypothetical protein
VLVTTTATAAATVETASRIPGNTLLRHFNCHLLLPFLFCDVN